MCICDSLFSQGCLLNEQIARQIFDILPEQGPIMVIMDRDHNCWLSDSEKFSKLNISESFLRKLCARSDDGAEPIVTFCDKSQNGGPFKKIRFWILLNNFLTFHQPICYCLKRKNRSTILSCQSLPNLKF